MNRRKFLKTAAAAGAASSLSTFTPNTQAVMKPAGRYWVFVLASGGWDPSCFWDPKGNEVTYGGSPINHYKTQDIRKVGNIQYPPQLHKDYDEIDNFTKKHHNKMLVLNGVDMATNRHRTGSYLAMSGTRNSTAPYLAALLAAPHTQNMPLPYIYSGGRITSIPEVPISAPLSKNNISIYETFDKNLGGSLMSNYLAKEKSEFLDIFRQNNIDSERKLSIAKELKLSRGNSSELQAIKDRIPMDTGATGQHEQVEMIAASFAAGWSATATLSVGNFDTHRHNEDHQSKYGSKYLKLVDKLWDELDRQGIAEQTTVVMLSEMGRKPSINSFDGKGHYAHTAVVLMGAGITGDRTIGQTDHRMIGNKIDPQTLQASDTGKRIKMEDIHAAIRKESGLIHTEYNLRYPISTDTTDFKFFS